MATAGKMALGNAHRAQNPSTRRQHRLSDTPLETLQYKRNTADNEQHQGEYGGARFCMSWSLVTCLGRSLWGEFNTTTSTARRMINVSPSLSFKSRGAIRAVIEALLAPDGLTLQGAIGRQLTRRHKKVIFALRTETLAQQKQCVRMYNYKHRWQTATHTPVVASAVQALRFMSLACSG